MHSHSRRKLAVLTALIFASLACASEGPSAPTASVSLHLVGAAVAITEADLITIRVRGTTPDSISAVRVGGVEAIAGYTDSTLLVVMPIGAPGPVNVAATVWSGGKDFPATVSATRASGPVVGDAATATATVLGEIDATIADLDARSLPAGVDSVLYRQELDVIRSLRDSLEAQLGRLDPSGRALALSFIAQLRGEPDVALTASQPSCDSQQGRVDCVRASKVSLAQDLFRIVKIIAKLGAGSLLALAAFGVTITGGIALAVIGAITAVALTTLSIDSREALADIVTSRYERALEPVVRIQASFDDLTNGSIRLSESGTSAAVSLPSFQPGVPVRLPIVRVTRSAIVGDTLPLVRGLADTVNLLAARFDELSELLPGGLSLPRRTVTTTPARTLTEPADFAEVSIVSIREGGAPAAGITGTLSDASPGINLTLNGDPGAGRDLTLRLALDGDGAGRVEFETAIRYEALPDTLDWAAAVLEGQWNARFVTPEESFYCPEFAFPTFFSNNRVLNGYAESLFSYQCAGSVNLRTWLIRLTWAPETGWVGFKGSIGVEVLEFTANTLRIRYEAGGLVITEVFTRAGS